MCTVVSPTHSHSHTLTLTLTPSHTYPHSHTLTLTHTPSHTYPHLHTLNPHTLTHTLSHTYPHPHTLIHTPSPTHSHTHTLTHTLIHTPSHTYPHPHTHIHTPSLHTLNHSETATVKKVLADIHKLLVILQCLLPASKCLQEQKVVTIATRRHFGTHLCMYWKFPKDKNICEKFLQLIIHMVDTNR